jgi:uncharacterized protein YjdB
MRRRGLWLCRAVILGGLAIGCGGGGDGPGIVNAPVVLSVTVPPPGVSTLDIGVSVQLTAVVDVQNGASQSVVWSSSSPTTATVDQSGRVTGVAGGPVTITATSTANPSKKGSASITVNPARVADVTLNGAPTRTVRVGQNFAVVATVATVGTLARTVTFSSSDPSKATVSSTDGLTATVQGVSVGPATITATSTVDVSKKAAIQVTVTGSVSITGVTPSPASVLVNRQIKLVPTVQADQGLSTAVTFESLNNPIATVAADGTVTGVAVGNANILIKSVGDPSVTLTVPVAVRSGVTSVTLTPDRDSVRPTLTRQLALSVNGEPGASTAVILSSANPAIVTVDNAARVTGVTIGQAWVRALSVADPSVGDSTLVVVVDPCMIFTPLPIGQTVPAAITDASCLKSSEQFKYTVTSQTALSIGGTFQFPATVVFFGDRSGLYGFGTTTVPTTGAASALVAPGTYTASVAMAGTQRGSFTMTVAPTAALAAFCGTASTTGINITLPINSCGFTPTGRPAGVYRSYVFSLLPYILAGDRLTISVTATGFTPLIETRIGSVAPVVTSAAGATSVTQTITAGAAGFATVSISSRDAGQTGTFTINIDGPPSLPPTAAAGQSRMTAPPMEMIRRPVTPSTTPQ